MSILERGERLGTLIVALAGLLLAPLAVADDAADVMAVVELYSGLEGDLEAQAELIRGDRVMITNARQSDQLQNLEIQIATRKAAEAANGGKTQVFSTIDSPKVAVYGNVAVVSFMRTFTFIPYGQPAAPPGQPLWVTLVLVKDTGDWGIAHTHLSPAGGN